MFVSALLSRKEESEYAHLLQEYKDVFVCCYKEMPRLDPRVAVRHGVRLIKQRQRRFRAELIPQIEMKVNKFIEAGFIREVKYPTWIATIIPVNQYKGHYQSVYTLSTSYEVSLLLQDLLGINLFSSMT